MPRNTSPSTSASASPSPPSVAAIKRRHQFLSTSWTAARSSSVNALAKDIEDMGHELHMVRADLASCEGRLQRLGLEHARVLERLGAPTPHDQPTPHDSDARREQELRKRLAREEKTRRVLVRKQGLLEARLREAQQQHLKAFKSMPASRQRQSLRQRSLPHDSDLAIRVGLPRSPKARRRFSVERPKPTVGLPSPIQALRNLRRWLAGNNCGSG